MTATKHGIDIDAFRFREAKKALAQAIFYARAQAFNLFPPHWDGASNELREEYLNFAEAVLRLPTVRQPADPEQPTVKTATDFRALFTRITRQYASGLRPTHGVVVGAIEPGEKR